MSSQVFDVAVVDAVDVGLNIPRNVSNVHFSSVSAFIRYDISKRIVLFVAMFCKFTPETSGLTCFQVCRVCNFEDTETVQSTPVSSYFTTKHRAKYAQIICAVEECLSHLKKDLC